jgi:molybdopterin/thiamine biosynthesis adenylyltransferase/rhodanese-related sulfurtransferase/molybdopterin converting factor small subunit
MPKVFIPTALYGQTDNRSEIDVPGARTLDEVLRGLADCCPNIRRHLFRGGGANEPLTLRSFVRIFIGDTDAQLLQGGATPVAEETEIQIVPSIAGGAGEAASPVAIELNDPESIELSNDEVLRYSRHLIMPEVAMEGQKRLKAASVLCIGTGGLGAPIALYLAAAGVGRIGLVDFDVVDFTNLQRQVIHGTKDVGRPKIESARETLTDLNPDIVIETYEEQLTSANALELFAKYDIIIDGTDNFPTRYLVNDACVLLGKPNVYGSIFRFDGQATVFWAKHGPCYRCLYPEPPPPGLVPSCAEGGVLGVLPGTVGCIQATEAVKLILGRGEPLVGRLLLFDALSMRFRELKLRKDPDCPVCGANPTVTELIDYEEFCGVGRGEEAAPDPNTIPEITATELKEKLDRGDDFVLVDVREPYEYAIARIPRARLVPLGQVAERAGELDRDKEIVLHCRSGKRSADALNQLRAQGFTRLKNLRGGILAWSDEVDPSVPKY